jgi:hypothetical protein
MYKFLIIFCGILFHYGLFAEKVLVITSAYNRPDFIEIQYNTFKKFLQDDYEFIVFNDANNLSLQQAIQNKCADLGIQCINIPQYIHDQPYLERWPNEGLHDPAVRNANVVQYALNNFGYKHKGIVAIIDSDMFLIKPFSIEDFLNGYDMAGVAQSSSKNERAVSYLWIGIAFLNMEKLPEKKLINFNCGQIEEIPVDAGGYMHYYLQKYPELKIKYFGPFYPPDLYCPACRNAKSTQLVCNHNGEELRRYGLGNDLINALHSGLENIEFFIHGAFFHYRGGTNWDHQTKEYHERKTRLFNEAIKNLLNSD